jgi:hypothetical protein
LTITVLALAKTSVIYAQLPIADAQFPLLAKLTWGMQVQNVQTVLEKEGVSARIEKSGIVWSNSIFGAAATTKFHFDKNSGLLRLIDVSFENPNLPLCDTLLSHFTTVLGKTFVQTTKEQKLVFMTLNMELTSWKIKGTALVVTLVKHGGEVFHVGFSIFPTNN